MMDFAVLPPEVNSGWIYSGAGSTSMAAAATAWDRLAAELHGTAMAYQDAVTGLADTHWHGPSSGAMIAAATPYTTWMHTAAEQAAQSAAQARMAAAAYDAAFAGTVPPPVIAANRTELATLIATNILGQNAPAIAANQAHYAEMWAQDATTMYSYAASSATASQLAPFAEPRRNTDPGAQAGQAAAQAAAQAGSTADSAAEGSLNGVQQGLVDAFTSPLMIEIEKLIGNNGPFLSVLSGSGVWGDAAAFGQIPFISAWVGQGLSAAKLGMAAGGAVTISDVAPSAAASGAFGSTLVTQSAPAGGGLGPAVSAGMGRAASVGGLSVPGSWNAVSDVRLASLSSPLPQAGASAAAPGGMYGGVPPIGSMVNAPRDGGSTRLKEMPRANLVPQLAGQGDDRDGESRWAPGEEAISQDVSMLSDREQLNELRRMAAALLKERDTLRSSAANLLREVMQ